MIFSHSTFLCLLNQYITFQYITNSRIFLDMSSCRFGVLKLRNDFQDQFFVSYFSFIYPKPENKDLYKSIGLISNLKLSLWMVLNLLMICYTHKSLVFEWQVKISFTNLNQISQTVTLFTEDYCL